MQTSIPTPEVEFVIDQIGNPASVRKVEDFGLETITETSRRVDTALPWSATNWLSVAYTMGSRGAIVDQLWPVERVIGDHIQIRGHEGIGFYIFDTKSKTMTGSPVSKVLKVAQNPQGETCVLVYGGLLGKGHDDMYAWISTSTGARMHVEKIGGNIDEFPMKNAPDGFEIMAA